MHSRGRKPAGLPSRTRAILLVVSVAALLVFVWLGSEVHTSRTQATDAHVRTVIHQHASRALTATLRYATHFGSVAALTVLSVVVLVGLCLVKETRAAIMLGIVMGGAGMLNTFLKDTFQRARPDPFFGILPPHSYSFPSGHALCSFCFYGILAAMFIPRIQARARRMVAWAATALVILLVGFSRVYLGVHYPTDVAGGWMIGLAWITAVVALYPQSKAVRR